jgi:hypothetical protein
MRIGVLLGCSALAISCGTTELPAQPSLSVARKAYGTCVFNNIEQLDDRVSDARTVAKVVLSRCRDEQRAFVEADFLDAGPKFKPSHKPEFIRQWEIEMNSFAVELVLSSRARNRQQIR